MNTVSTAGRQWVWCDRSWTSLPTSSSANLTTPHPPPNLISQQFTCSTSNVFICSFDMRCLMILLKQMYYIYNCVEVNIDLHNHNLWVNARETKLQQFDTWIFYQCWKGLFRGDNLQAPPKRPSIPVPSDAWPTAWEQCRGCPLHGLHLKWED